MTRGQSLLIGVLFLGAVIAVIFGYRQAAEDMELDPSEVGREPWEQGDFGEDRCSGGAPAGIPVRDGSRTLAVVDANTLELEGRGGSIWLDQVVENLAVNALLLVPCRGEPVALKGSDLREWSLRANQRGALRVQGPPDETAPGALLRIEVRGAR